MMVIHKSHVLNLGIEMNVYDRGNVLGCLNSSKKGMKNPGLNGDSNHDLCDVGAVLYQLSYQAGSWSLCGLNL